jgi:hypothetical protein
MTANMTVVGNVFFNGPRAGINVNDGFGGGHEISRNVGFNLVRETTVRVRARAACRRKASFTPLAHMYTQPRSRARNIQDHGVYNSWELVHARAPTPARRTRHE